MKVKLNRRQFLRASVMAAVGVAAASCAQPEPQVIEKPVTVVVEKEVPVEKQVIQTVVVEKEVPVEKRVVETVTVKETVVVEKQVVVAPTAIPAKFKEAPILADRVARGELPPVDERLPENPYVVTPLDGIGKYGGDLTMLVAAASDTKLSHVYGGTRLVRYDFTLSELLPDLAEKFEVNEGRDFTIYLRKGLKWSDGEPYTTDDFRFFWEDVALNTDLNPNGVPSWLLVNGEAPTVVFPDDYTVRFTWTSINKTFLPAIAGSMAREPWMPKHYMIQFHPKYGDKATIDQAIKDGGYQDWMALFNANQRYYYQDIPNYPTLMPWVPTFRPPQEKYTFVRNPYFHKVDTDGNQLPYFDNLVFLTTDIKLIPLKCTAGDADMQQRNLAFSDITLLKENETQGGYQARLWRSDSASFMRLEPNYDTKDTVLAQLYLDKRFRQALSLAVDRQEINDVLFLGYGVPQQPELVPGVVGYNEEWAQAYAQYDPDQANKLLDEVGLTGRDAEGYRLRPDGASLELMIEDAGENPSYADIIELITATFKGVGIKVLYKFSERATYRERMQSGDAPMGLWGCELGLDFTTGAALLADGVVCRQDNTDGFNNWGIWYQTQGASGVEPPATYKQMQDLVSEWMITADEAESNNIRDQIRAILAEERYQIGTVGGLPVPVVVKNSMRNVPVEGFCLWSRGGYFYWAEPAQWWKEA